LGFLIWTIESEKGDFRFRSAISGAGGSGGTLRRRWWVFILCRSAKNEPRKRAKGQALWKPALLRNALFGALGRGAVALLMRASKVLFSENFAFAV
jgi:hypothetical protein